MTDAAEAETVTWTALPETTTATTTYGPPSRDMNSIARPAPMTLSPCHRNRCRGRLPYRDEDVEEDGETEWSNEPMARRRVSASPPPPTGSGGGGGLGPAPVAPSFGDGFRTTRAVAGNAGTGHAVGEPVFATS